ncbi:MAG: YraN family protein [Propionibacteriaceae bacterium]|jgi:putative endonuclease|nr:YraN family protein [Propionibacteriaceae bacterium]
MDERRALGALGEQLVAEQIQNWGWEILARNWRCRFGELDIVAREPSSPPTLVFIEVKTRRRYREELAVPPLDAITVKKVRKLHELAFAWMSDNPGARGKVRFDAAAVIVDQDKREFEYRRGLDGGR